MWLEVDFFNKDLTIFLFLIIAGCGIGHTPFDGKGQQRVGMGKPQPEGVQLRSTWVHQPEGGGSEAEACRCVEAGEEHPEEGAQVGFLRGLLGWIIWSILNC